MTQLAGATPGIVYPTCITLEVYKIPGPIQNSGFEFSRTAGTDDKVNHQAAEMLACCLSLPLLSSCRFFMFANHT